MADIGFDSTAIAWVLAHNSEQADSFSAQKKKYRKGIIEGVKGSNKKIEEDISDLTDSDFPLNLDFTPDINNPGNNSGGDYLFDFSGDGSIYLKFVSMEDPNKYYGVRIFVDHTADHSWLWNGSSFRYFTCKGRIGVEDYNGTTSYSGGRPHSSEGAWFYQRCESQPDYQIGGIHSVNIYTNRIVIKYLSVFGINGLNSEKTISFGNSSLMTFVSAGKHPIESG